MPELEIPSEIGGCRIEAVAWRGAVATGYRAVRERDGRAMAILVPALEAEEEDGYRERFLHAARLVAELEHPNVLEVYGGGESEGVLFQMARWVDGVDLRTWLASRGPVPAAEALSIMRPVARALAAAHQVGLTHGGLDSEAVLLASGADGEDEHVYLTGFGFRQPPQGEGGPADDVAAFGGLLSEMLAKGRSAADRDQRIVDKRIGAGLRLLIARAIEADPERRFASGEELSIALERECAAARAVPLAPAMRRVRVDAAADEGDAEEADVAIASSGARRPRLLAAVTATAVAIVLIVTLATHSGTGPHIAPHAPPHTAPPAVRHMPRPAAPQITSTVTLGSLELPQTIDLPGPATGLFVTPASDAWVSIAARNELVEIHGDGTEQTFNGIPGPGPLVSGSAGVWVTLPARDAVALFADGRLNARVALSGRPLAIALDARGKSAWVGDAAGGVSRVGGASPLTVHIGAPATGLAVGEPNWVWAADGKLVRVGPSGRGADIFAAGSQSVAVAVDQGIWVAQRNGAVTRFDPRAGQEHAAASIMAPAPVTGIAAREGSPFVWAISAQARSLYEIDVARPRIVGIVRFGSSPTFVAVTHLGVWVTTAAGPMVRVQR